MTKNDVDLKHALLNEYDTPYSIYDGKYTKTTQFMLPSIDVDIRNRMIFKFFINSYLDDKEFNHSHTRPIFILFGVKDFKDKDWDKVYVSLALSKNYLMDYDCGMQDTINLVMMVFQVPEEFAEDYYHFKQGRYSKFSKNYKNKFSRYISEDSEKESIIWQIIHKSHKLKRELEKEFDLNIGEFDKPTIIEKDGNRNTYQAEEIWDLPRKEREYYRYIKK